MKRGSFHDAMKTFNDAVFVMKHGVCSLQGNNSDSATTSPAPAAAVSCLDLKEKMKHADQRLAYKPKGPSSVEAFKTFHFADLHQIDGYDLCRKPEQPTIWLVCLETDLTSTASRDLDTLIAGAMLCNQGASYRCLLNCDPALEAHRKLRVAATRIFQLADSIVHRVLANTASSCASEIIHRDWELWKLAARTAMAVLYSLVNLFADRRERNDTMMAAAAAHDEISRRLFRLRQWYIRAFCQINDSNVIAAAAA